MNSAWFFGLLLIIQPINPTESLIIENQGEMITTIHRNDYTMSFPGIPIIDLTKYNAFIEKLDEQTYKPPVNAYINNFGSVIEGEPGRKLYRKAFNDLFYSYFYKTNASRVQVPMLPIYPRIDRDLLLRIYVKQIGQYVTYFNRNNTARSHNITLASEAINNYVIFPGEKFSFNQVVGKRTKERGYMRAPVIVRGELAEDIGGGICQVSSTLFNAADRAGLKMVERYSHSKKVPYVPPGRDATVSWYGPDFSFMNEYSLPVLIRSKVLGGQMIIQIFSSDEIDYEPRPVPSTKKVPYLEIQREKEIINKISFSPLHLYTKAFNREN
ncbi:VanW family protein [Cytobacillus massiliigabonensis]|uniref:VanW family protein n=1 Tax=Cytobacillus massiliigabonensis TaxID=1871011 RepID=UPI000C8192ED|nr:VanW family protein [Cytobacillus massiliigabonensis]